MSNLTSRLPQQQRNAGFTLVELVTVVTIMAIIAAYITVRLGGTTDDAKLGIARTVLLKDIPEAILGYQSRHGMTCGTLADITTNATELSTTDGSIANTFVDFGANAETPWGDGWKAGYHHTSRTITVGYPIIGVQDNETLKGLVESLKEQSVVAWVDAATSDTSITVSTATPGSTKTDLSFTGFSDVIYVGYRCI